MEKITVLWDMQIQIGTGIKTNKPDIVNKNWKEKRCMVDVAIPSEMNTLVKVIEKLSK